EPRRRRGDERSAGAGGDRAAEAPVRADEARRQRREDEHRLEPLAEDEEAAVDDDRAVAERDAAGGRIGHGARGRRLPAERTERGGGDEAPRAPPQQAPASGELLGGGTAATEHVRATLQALSPSAWGGRRPRRG